MQNVELLITGVKQRFVSFGGRGEVRRTGWFRGGGTVALPVAPGTRFSPGAAGWAGFGEERLSASLIGCLRQAPNMMRGISFPGAFGTGAAVIRGGVGARVRGGGRPRRSRGGGVRPGLPGWMPAEDEPDGDGGRLAGGGWDR
ncbi:hypothetical protein GCM10022223_62080 [Kineosporia mesophila]|uniref:Uncharacterized protein n=1 Tax=Kineosporia mesophila TaxID=566012 RepID=A0ABP7AM56_9ACTN